MAYDLQRSGRNYGAPAGRYDNRGSSQQGNWNGRSGAQYDQPKPVEARMLPVNYVDEAERVMEKLKEENRFGKFDITTSKLRAIHALVADIYNVENLRTEAELLEESQLKLMRLRVRIVYDAGREKAVMRFVEKTNLLNYIKGIGKNRAEMIRFAHYMEALVAYHRFLGGREY